MSAFVAECAVEERGQTCGAPTQGFLCSKHRDELVLWLWDIGGVALGDSGEYQVSLLDELDTTICGDDKIGGASIGIAVKAAETPLAFNSRASDAKTALVNGTTSWARVFAEENPHLLFEPATVEDASRWMASFPGLLEGHPAAVEMHSDFRDLVHAARRAIDRPSARVYAGNCGSTPEGSSTACTAPVFALEDSPVARCRECGAEFWVEERYWQILDGLRARVTTPRLIEQALNRWAGITVNVKTIRTWVNRGLLVNRAHDAKTVLVRVGDFLDLARERGVIVDTSSCEEAA